MIEIFSRNPDFIILEDDAVLTPLLIDDEISSLSAILLNEAYYELLKTGQKMVDGIPVLSPTCLIPFKAKAWLDLKERKLNGDQVGSKRCVPISTVNHSQWATHSAQEVLRICWQSAIMRSRTYACRGAMNSHRLCA